MHQRHYSRIHWSNTPPNYLRQQMMGHYSSIAQHSKPLARATPPSLQTHKVRTKQRNSCQLPSKRQHPRQPAWAFPFWEFCLQFFYMENGKLLFLNSFDFQTFFIMAIGYIIELILPYVIMLCIMLTFNLISCIGLTHSLIVIHSVRLVSSLIMLLLTRMQYPLLHYSVSRIHVYLYRSTCVSVCTYLLLALVTHYPLTLTILAFIIK